MNLLRANRPTSASITLFEAVAPPAHSRLRRLYEDTFTFQVLRLNDNVPTVPQRRNAAYYSRNEIKKSIKSTNCIFSTLFSLRTQIYGVH